MGKPCLPQQGASPSPPPRPLPDSAGPECVQRRFAELCARPASVISRSRLSPSFQGEASWLMNHSRGCVPIMSSEGLAALEIGWPPGGLTAQSYLIRSRIGARVRFPGEKSARVSSVLRGPGKVESLLKAGPLCRGSRAVWSLTAALAGGTPRS